MEAEGEGSGGVGDDGLVVTDHIYQLQPLNYQVSKEVVQNSNLEM